MKIQDTIKMMTSEDFKERFRAEYFQLVNRIEKFSITLDGYRKNTLKFIPKCTLKLLDGQMNTMIMYRTHLEESAKIEGISLEEVISNKTQTISPDPTNHKYMEDK